jgi:hypothetical protein
MNKPKLIEVTDPKELTALALTASLDKPFMFSNRVGALTHFWADAEELRAWRAAQATSGAEQ